MLKMSDTPIERFLPFFTNAFVPVAFLVPTPTGYSKSIMDATSSVRGLLKDAHIHDYVAQGQGPENKVVTKGHYVETDKLDEMDVSMYRPKTKQGDPRIWFSKLTRYCNPCNLLALFVIRDELYVANLSNPAIAASLIDRGFLFNLIQQAGKEASATADELLALLHRIHNRGFIPSITRGDPGVGDTLENALGISRNNEKTPDYKGIELKASRKKQGSPTRNTLFTQVPLWDDPHSMSEADILKSYGYWGKSKDGVDRFQLYCTISAIGTNSQGLFLQVENDSTVLNVKHEENSSNRQVTLWKMETLKSRLLEKHPATFWIKATSKFEDGKEYFRYDHVKYTRNPIASVFPDLLDSGIITVDFLMHQKPNGIIRDHGFPFKILPSNINMLFPEPLEYDL